MRVIAAHRDSRILPSTPRAGQRRRRAGAGRRAPSGAPARSRAATRPRATVRPVRTLVSLARDARCDRATPRPHRRPSLVIPIAPTPAWVWMTPSRRPFASRASHPREGAASSSRRAATRRRTAARLALRRLIVLAEHGCPHHASVIAVPVRGDTPGTSISASARTSACSDRCARAHPLGRDSTVRLSRPGTRWRPTRRHRRATAGAGQHWPIAPGTAGHARQR